MCGIVGIASIDGMTGRLSRIDWFKQALYMDTLRGYDSTGVALIRKKSLNEPLVFKRAEPGFDFIEDKRVERLLQDMDEYVFAIGHNRAATKGLINKRNAHPFTHDHITGVHNGTLYNWHKLDGDASVDSSRIFATMAKRGAKETIEMLDGSYALAWYDSTDQSLNLARNSHRPLSFAVTQFGKTMVFASEEWMLSALCQRNNIHIKDVYELTPGYIIKWKADTADFNDWEETPFDIYTPPATTTGHNVFNNGYAGYQSKYNNVTPPITPKYDKREEKVVKLLAQLGFKLGQKLTFDAFDWQPYEKNPDRGELIGFVWNSELNTGYHVSCHNFNKDELEDDLDDNPTMVGTIISAYEKHGWTTIRVGSVQPEEVVWDDEYDDDDVWEVNNNEIIKTTSKIFVPGPEGTWVSEERMLELTQKGCVMCSRPIGKEEFDYLVWTSDHQPYCPDCVSDAQRAGQSLTAVIQ